MHACSPSRTAQALQHLLEAIPLYDPGGNMVGPRIPQCCDTPDAPFGPGVECGCFCHCLTDEDLAQIPDVPEKEDAIRSDRLDDDNCPKSGEPLLREEADIGVGIMYGPPWCSDPTWGWQPPRYGPPKELEASKTHTRPTPDEVYDALSATMRSLETQYPDARIRIRVIDLEFEGKVKVTG